MRAVLFLFAILTAGPVLAQSACFMDSTDPAQRPRIEGALERLVLAHIPIEYRNSCGLRDESDQRFWAAIRDSVSCQGSENYQSYFGPFLEDKDKYLLAASKTDLAATQAETYAVDRLLAGYYLLPTGWRRACGATPEEMRNGFTGIWRGVGCSPESDAWQTQAERVESYAAADPQNITVTGCDIEQEFEPEWPAFCAAVHAYPYGADPSVGDVFEPLRGAADALRERGNQEGCFE